MHTKLKTISIFLLAFLIFAPGVVSAEEATTTSESQTTSSASSTTRTELEKIRRMSAAERMQKAAELRSKATQEKCTALTTNIDRRLTYYDENYENQVNVFQNLRTRVNLALTRLDNLGLDVTELRADYTALGVMIVDFNQIRNDLIAKLQGSKNYACGQGDGMFRSAMQEAETLVTQLRGKSREIKTFVQNDLKESLQAVKQQASSNN